MRFTLAALLLVTSSGFAKSVSPAKTGMLYKAVDGLAEVTVVELEPKQTGEALLKIDNADSALDGLVLLHKKQTQGNAQAYVLDFEGNRTRLRVQNSAYSLYLPESPTKEIKLKWDRNGSKAIDTKKLAKEYDGQDPKVVNAKLQKAYNP